jgi:hypothetical protein
MTTSPAQVHVTRCRSRDRSVRGSADLAAVVSVEPVAGSGDEPPVGDDEGGAV